MITFDKDNVCFNYRVAGVAIHDGNVLLQKTMKDSFWFLPGGRAELRESAEETLKREMREELNTDVTVERLLWVVENFFENDNKTFHELGLYFLMSFPEDSHIYDIDQVFFGEETGQKFIVQWHALDKLDSILVYPSFLQTALQALPYETEHVVHIDH